MSVRGGRSRTEEAGGGDHKDRKRQQAEGKRRKTEAAEKPFGEEQREYQRTEAQWTQEATGGGDGVEEL